MGLLFEVVRSYLPAKKDGLALIVGHVIECSSADSENGSDNGGVQQGWGCGRDVATGHEGWFPMSHVTRIAEHKEEADPQSCASELLLKRTKLEAMAKESLQQQQHTGQEQDDNIEEEEEETVEVSHEQDYDYLIGADLLRATHSFESRAYDELSLRNGESVRVVEESEDEWLLVVPTSVDLSPLAVTSGTMSLLVGQDIGWVPASHFIMIADEGDTANEESQQEEKETESSMDASCCGCEYDNVVPTHMTFTPPRPSYPPPPPPTTQQLQQKEQERSPQDPYQPLPSPKPRRKAPAPPLNQKPIPKPRAMKPTPLAQTQTATTNATVITATTSTNTPQCTPRIPRKKSQQKEDSTPTASRAESIVSMLSDEDDSFSIGPPPVNPPPPPPPSHQSSHEASTMTVDSHQRQQGATFSVISSTSPVPWNSELYSGLVPISRTQSMAEDDIPSSMVRCLRKAPLPPVRPRTQSAPLSKPERPPPPPTPFKPKTLRLIKSNEDGLIPEDDNNNNSNTKENNSSLFCSNNTNNRNIQQKTSPKHKMGMYDNCNSPLVPQRTASVRKRHTLSVRGNENTNNNTRGGKLNAGKKGKLRTPNKVLKRMKQIIPFLSSQ